MRIHINGNVLVSYRQSYGETSYTVPDGIEIIRRNAFLGCDRLTSITLPDSVRVIEPNAFLNCRSLRELRFGDQVNFIWPEAFTGTPWYEEQRQQEFVILGDGILYAYNPMDRERTHVTVPEGVKYLGLYVFEEHRQLRSVTLPEGLLELRMACFRHCTSLQTLKLPSSLQTVEAAALFGCDSLMHLHIPHSVRRIDVYGLPGYPHEPKTAVFETPWGDVAVPVAHWENNANEKRFLDLLHEEDQHMIEQLFRIIRKTEYKQSLGARLAEAFPEQRYYQSYLRRIVKLAIARMTDEGDVSGVEQLLNLRAVTRQNIDPLISAAHAAGQHEIYAMLVRYKSETVGYTPEERKLLL